MREPTGCKTKSFGIRSSAFGCGTSLTWVPPIFTLKLFWLKNNVYISTNVWPATFKRKVCVCVRSCFSRVRLWVTLWTAHHAPLSMRFSRQKYWSGLPFPSSRGSSRPRNWTHISVLAGRFFTSRATWEAPLEKWCPPKLFVMPDAEPQW